MWQALLYTFAFVGLGSCSCSSLEVLEGMTTALCTDEVTGFDFQFVDFAGRYGIPDDQLGSIHTTQAAAQMLDIIYAEYRNASSVQSRDVALPARPDANTARWQVCGDRTTGVCSNTNIIGYSGAISGFIGAVTGILSYVNSRQNNNPRSVCTNYNNASICVSWALYSADSATDQQIMDIATNCGNVCQQFGDSCESRIIEAATTQYFCVSNRADHCAENSDCPVC